MNIEKLASKLRRGEAFLITSAENCFYFTGFQLGEGVLLITPKERVYMTDGRYIEAANAAITCCTEIIDAAVFTDEIEKICSAESVKKLFVETGRITLGFYEKLRKALKGTEVAGGERLEKEIDALRSVKSAQEFEKIRKAQEIAERGFDYILGRIKPGMREIEIARELDYFMLTNGAQAVSFDTIAVTGAKTSMPHGVPGDEIIKQGDLFLLDFGAVYEGYHSDMTRTVAVGEIDGKKAEIYNIVLEAQKRALGFLAPGKHCKDADAAARDYIKEKGYGEKFTHSTGHGVGVEIHEKPNLSSRNEKGVLQEGNIVTVEPGIYLAGEFGVRIEDMALITPDGSENLTKCKKELIVL